MCEAEETTIHVGDISMVHQYTSTFPGTEVVKNCPTEYKGTQNKNIFKTFSSKMKKKWFPTTFTPCIYYLIYAHYIKLIFYLDTRWDPFVKINKAVSGLIIVRKSQF